MIIVHYLKCRKENDDELFKAVRKGLFAYGLPQEEVPEGVQQPEKLGPFSIRSYLKYMIKDKTWGDIIYLYLLASMWAVRLKVVNSSTLGEMRIRHNMPLDLVDLAVVFNSCETAGHFSACIRANKEMLIAGKLLKSNGYQIEKDIADRLLYSKLGAAELLAYSDLKFIVMSEEELCKSGVALKDIKKTVQKMDEGGFIEGKTVPDKQIERPVHKEQEVQVYKMGDTKCAKCDQDFQKSYLLQRHLDRYHRNMFAYNCPKCNKGLSTGAGLKEHLLSHTDDGDEQVCPTCGKGFKIKDH